MQAAAAHQHHHHHHPMYSGRRVVPRKNSGHIPCLMRSSYNFFASRSYFANIRRGDQKALNLTFYPATFALGRGQKKRAAASPRSVGAILAWLDATYIQTPFCRLSFRLSSARPQGPFFFFTLSFLAKPNRLATCDFWFLISSLS